MSSLHHNSAASPPAPAPPADASSYAPPDPAALLAHELANLLDGGLRNLGLALSRLRDAPSHAALSPNGPPADAENLLRRLEAANDAMRQMAALIQRWREPSGGAAGPAPTD